MPLSRSISFTILSASSCLSPLPSSVLPPSRSYRVIEFLSESKPESFFETSFAAIRSRFFSMSFFLRMPQSSRSRRQSLR